MIYRETCWEDYDAKVWSWKCQWSLHGLQHYLWCYSGSVPFPTDMSVCATQSLLARPSTLFLIFCDAFQNISWLFQKLVVSILSWLLRCWNERYLFLREHHSHFSKKFSFQNYPYSCLIGTPMHVLIDHVERSHQKYQPSTTNTYFISTLCNIFNNGKSNLIALVNLYVRL